MGAHFALQAIEAYDTLFTFIDDVVWCFQAISLELICFRAGAFEFKCVETKCLKQTKSTGRQTRAGGLGLQLPWRSTGMRMISSAPSQLLDCMKSGNCMAVSFPPLHRVKPAPSPSTPDFPATVGEVNQES